MNDALCNIKMQHTLFTSPLDHLKIGLYKTTHTNEGLIILILIVEPSVCWLAKFRNYSGAGPND